MIAAKQGHLTYAQAAERIGCKVGFIRARVKDGSLPVEVLGYHTRRIAETDLLEFIARSRRARLFRK